MIHFSFHGLKGKKIFWIQRVLCSKKTWHPLCSQWTHLSQEDQGRTESSASPQTDSSRSQILGTPLGLGALGCPKFQKRMHNSYQVLGRVGAELVPQATVLFSRLEIPWESKSKDNAEGRWTQDGRPRSKHRNQPGGS